MTKTEDRTPACFLEPSDKYFKIAHRLTYITFGFWSIMFAVVMCFYKYYYHWAWWLCSLTIFVPFICKFIASIRQIITTLKQKAFTGYLEKNVFAITVDGKVGTGKTSSLLSCFKVLADEIWGEICRAVKMLECFKDDIPYWHKNYRELANELLETYEFFSTSGTYPLLYTTVPCMIDGKFTNKLTADHLMQKKKLPYGALAVIDESSLVLPQKLYIQNLFELKELFKFLRHYGDFRIGATEQDKSSNFVELRRACAKFVHIIEQTHVQKSVVLQWVYNFIFKHTKHFTKRKFAFFYRFKRLIDNFGYRKYSYKEYYEGEKGEKVFDSNIKHFYLKPSLDIVYESRAYKNGYRCKDQKLEISAWTDLYLSAEELKQVFSDDLKEMTKSKAERKAAARAATAKRKNAEKQAKENVT